MPSKYKIFVIVILFTVFAGITWFYVAPLGEPEITKIPNTEPSFLKIPEGFEIAIVAKNLDNPRVIAFDSKGRMLVSETKAGRVSVLEDIDLEKLQVDPGADMNGDFENKRTLIENLKSPHGLDFFTDKDITYLYIAETQQVARYVYDANTGKLIDTVGKNITNLPADGRHFTRTIAFGPNFRKSQIIGTINTQVDTKLYISVGSSCDVCVEDTWKQAAILESDPAGTYTAEFAGGLRNSVFFDFHPKTKEIWATEMGRDDLGDNLPPDEVNIIRAGEIGTDEYGAKRYGWPFCYGDKIKDMKFSPGKVGRFDIPQDCSKTVSPVIKIAAHSAPLGLVFIPAENGWPKEWEGDLLVALHGSWNRSTPLGYKIVRYDLDAGGNILSQEPTDFITGWLGNNNKILGRPVALKFRSDGALYISDDTAGVIYKMAPK